MMIWHHEKFIVRLREGTAESRDGLVSQDGVWGLHRDGEHIAVTHIPSGFRLWRFRQLGPATEAVRAVAAMDIAWNTTTPMIDEPTTLHIELIVREHEAVK